MKERRKYPRYKARVEIKYKRLDKLHARWQQDPYIKDISLGGMLFNVCEAIPPSTKLIFKLQLFSKGHAVKMLELRARVVSSEETMVSHDTRVRFIGLNRSKQADLKELIEYLQSWSQ